MLIEAAWAAAKAPVPLHAFFVRIRARRGRRGGRGSQPRRALLALLTKGEDYVSVRSALVANKARAMQLQTGHPQQKGSRHGPAYA